MTNEGNQIFFRNFLENLPAIAEGMEATSFYREESLVPVGIPAFVVGAGPSLDKNIGLLWRVAGRGVILSTDAAYKPLRAMGVVPDFIVTTDPGNTLPFLSDCDLEKSTLLFEVGCNPAITRLFPPERRIAMFAWNTIAGQVVRRIGAANNVYLSQLAGWGSVLNMAVAFCSHALFSPVVLVGADYAFTDGRRYCNGFAGGVNQAEQLFPISDLKGNLTYTSPLFVLYAKWLEMQQEEYRSPLINATEGGILRTKRIQPLADVISKHCRKAITLRIPKESPYLQWSAVETWKASMIAEIGEFRTDKDEARHKDLSDIVRHLYGNVEECSLDSLAVMLQEVLHA